MELPKKIRENQYHVLVYALNKGGIAAVQSDTAIITGGGDDEGANSPRENQVLLGREKYPIPRKINK